MLIFYSCSNVNSCLFFILQDEGFQEDLFPDDYAGVAALDGSSWLAGKNKAPIMTSMDPEHMASAAATAAAAGASAAVYKPKGPKSLAELKRCSLLFLLL